MKSCRIQTLLTICIYLFHLQEKVCMCVCFKKYFYSLNLLTLNLHALFSFYLIFILCTLYFEFTKNLLYLINFLLISWTFNWLIIILGLFYLYRLTYLKVKYVKWFLSLGYQFLHKLDILFIKFKLFMIMNDYSQLI